MIVKRFPKTDPDIEQAEAAAKSAEKAAGHGIAQPGELEQDVVVGPLGRPRKDNEQNPGNRADQNEEENGSAVQPELQALMGGFRVNRGRFEKCGARVRWRGLS